VILNRDYFSNIMAQRSDDQLLTGAIPGGPSSGLEAVLQLIDCKPIDLLLQLSEHGGYYSRHSRLPFHNLLADDHPFFHFAVIHSCERHFSLPIRQIRFD